MKEFKTIIKRYSDEELIDEMQNYLDEIIIKREFIREYDGSMEQFEKDYKKIDKTNKEIMNKIKMLSDRFMEVSKC